MQVMVGSPSTMPASNAVAVASPAVTNAIRFYDGLRFLGAGNLSANGTLATLQIDRVTPGWHFYTAQYPKDAYSTLNSASSWSTPLRNFAY
jgi:hypothetical protein